MNFQEKLEEFSSQHYLAFKDVLDLKILEKINQRLDELRIQNGPGSFHIVDGQISALIAPLLQSEGFKKVDSLCRQITLHQCQNKYTFAADARDHQVIRCADAHSANIANGRHYDSYLQTLLIPLQLAEPSDANGDLLLYKKSRNTHTSAKNLIEKAMAKYTGASPKQREAKSFRDLKSGLCQRVESQVGSVYFFNGFRTKHCNLSVSSGERRSLLLHSYNPTLDFNIGKILRAVRRASGAKTQSLEM